MTIGSAGPREAPACPCCGSRRVRPVVYGYPTRELARRAERGEVVLGGCELPAEASWRCADCEAEW